MKKITSILKQHIQKDFEWQTYGLVFVFLAVTILLNYKFDFEDSIIDAYAQTPLHIVCFFLFFGFAYFGTTLILVLTKKIKVFKSRSFWMMSTFGLTIMAIDSGFPYIVALSEEFPREISYFSYKVIRNIISLFTIFLPLLFYYKLSEDKNNFFGMSIGSNLKPYLLMLLIMIPIIYWASLQPDFLKSYPSYKSNTAYQYLKIPAWSTAGVFEIAYAWDFVNVELLFRGFFVIGLAKIFGKDAILPMVVTYAFYHFGKPMAETIGSVFGGYILGIIAFYTRSIWGGIIIHVGVAMLMEVAAFLQQ